MIDDKTLKECEKILKKYFREEGNVISVLQDLQNKFGRVPREAVYWFSEELNIPASAFFGVATFYSQFHLKPRGRHIITACCGTACHVKGADPIVHWLRQDLKLAEGDETTADMQFTFESVACMGACSMAPVIKIDKRVYGNMTPEEAVEVLDDYKGKKRR
jgi:NADH:ubiquinone oxidoreductase subunit E